MIFEYERNTIAYQPTIIPRHCEQTAASGRFARKKTKHRYDVLLLEYGVLSGIAKGSAGLRSHHLMADKTLEQRGDVGEQRGSVGFIRRPVIGIA